MMRWKDMPEGHHAYADPELHHWLRWASERGNTPVFISRAAEVALIACIPDYLLLRPVLLELKRRYPEGIKVSENPGCENLMAAYGAGDYGKVKFADENGGESEWMWVRVGYCAEENRGLFGRLDSRPVVLASKRLSV